MFDRLKEWAKNIKLDIVALYLAARDPRVPWYAKAMAGLVAAYALSPLDLIPDFVPVLGYLDDVILLPLGILFAVRLIPADVMADLRRQAEEKMETSLPGITGAVLIVLLWVAAAALLAWVILGG